MLDKEEAKKLMEIEGEARGIVFQVDYEFLLEKGGEEAVKKAEEKMAELGYPLKYKDIKPTDSYPIGLDALSMLVIKEIFNLDEKGLENMGRSVIKFSLFLKIFMRYFASLDLIAKEIPEIWQEHFTIGKLEMPEHDKEKKRAILRVKNFKVHPIYCPILKGYFSKVSEMVVKAPIKCEETKCVFKGDEYHEYLLTW